MVGEIIGVRTPGIVASEMGVGDCVSGLWMLKPERSSELREALAYTGTRHHELFEPERVKRAIDLEVQI